MSLETLLEAMGPPCGSDGDGLHYRRGPVLIAVQPDHADGWLDLNRIESADKGHGHGSAALDWIVGLADAHGVPLSLYARSMGGGLSTPELIDWYGRHGFTGDGYVAPDPADEDHIGSDMWRNPPSREAL